MDGVLRPDVLSGRRVALACRAGSGTRRVVALTTRLSALGADAVRLEIGSDEDAIGAQVAAVAVDADVLVWDGVFARAGEDAAAGRHGSLDGAWLATRAVATTAWIGAGREGLVVLLAPAPRGADEEAARAGLENLARTLSIEWARYGVRTVAVHPGPGTTDDEIAEIVAYLASPAGGYFSGSVVTLGTVAVSDGAGPAGA